MSGRALTFCIKYARFFVQKSCDEDMRTRKDSQRGAHLVQELRNPAGDDTTSELRGRNAPTGAPVTVPMSDGLGRNQGGTVEYCNCCIRLLSFPRFYLFLERQ